MPFLTELAAAAQIGDGEYATLIQPKAPRDIEVGPDTNAKAAIAAENRWILTGQSGASLANDVERNHRAVFRGHQRARHFHIDEAHRRFSKQGGGLDPFFVSSWIVTRPRIRLGISLGAVQNVIPLCDQYFLDSGRLAFRGSPDGV